MPRGTFVPSIVIPRVSDGLSGHLKAIHHQCRKLKRLQPPRLFLELLRRLAHEVTAGGTLARATRLQLGRGFVAGFVISGRRSDSTLGFFAEGFEVVPDFERTRGRDTWIPKLSSPFVVVRVRACPWARRSPRRPLSGVGAERSLLVFRQVRLRGRDPRYHR